MPLSPHSFHTLTTPRAVAVGLACFGICMMLQWCLQLPFVKSYPQFAKLGLNVPLMFLAAGVALLARTRQVLAARPPSILADGVSLILIVYPALVLSQTLFQVSLGLDFVRFPTPPTPESPHPGRMSPNASLGFIFAGVSLWLLRRPPSGLARVGARIAVAVVAIIGTLGLLGRALGLEQLYRIASYDSMLATTATCLFALAVGLWILVDALSEASDGAPAQLERRMSQRVMATLTLVALASGVVGFAVLRNTFEASVMQDAQTSARTSALVLDNTLETGMWFTKTMATRPTVVDAFSRVHANATDAKALDLLPKLAQSFLSAKVDSVRFAHANGRELARAGSGPAENAGVANTLDVPGARAELRWQGGYILHIEAPVLAGTTPLGTVITQQRLTLFDQVLANLRDHGETTDALICSRDGARAVCAPSKIYGQPSSIPMFDAAGKPAFPISRALLGESGVLFVRDLRGIPVIAGYTPIGKFGLGLVVKSDVSTLYAPLRDRLHMLALLLIGLVAAGTWALRSRVKPLLQSVVAEQQRTQTILDTSSDAFISIDIHGNVRDWNKAAAQLFGWDREEAVGRGLAELIIPPQHQDAHNAGFSRFIQSGAGPVVNRRTEITGWHRNGYEIPVELSISAVKTPQGYVANAFVRDIRERKEAQTRLEVSEKRLHEVLSNIPAMVGHFDREERCLFANELALKVHGMGRDAAIGRHLRDGISKQAYAIHKPHIERVLQGRRARFEGFEQRGDVANHYQVNLVPERGADGTVQGFYLMTFDVTELKQAKVDVERSQERLRAITDNLPVLISYIDQQQRLLFANRTFEAWTGVPADAALGKPLREVLGNMLHAEHEEPLSRSLRGERVEFETASQLRGVQRFLQTVYVPDMASAEKASGVYALTTDVTELRMAERRMAELASSDSLTGLANRRRFDERLPEALARARRARTGVALMFLDIDHFKRINDTFGHGAGDAVLIQFGARLAASVRETDFVARLAGDEFVVLLEGLHSAQEGETVAEKVVAAVRQITQVEGEELSVTTSIGIAYLTARMRCEPEMLLKVADRALYVTKEAGRDGFTCTSVEQPGFLPTGMDASTGDVST